MKKKLIIGAVLFTLLSGSASEMFPAYTGDIYPTPRNIVIGEKDFELTRVHITGMENSPQRLELEKRLKDRGVQILSDTAPGSVHIRLAVADTMPKKSEGYSVAMDEHQITVTGCDKNGLLWGISSLLQMTHRKNDKIFIKEFNGTDWPEYPLRGYMYLPMAQDGYFMMMFKLNFHVIPYAAMVAPLPGSGRRGFWQNTPPTANWIKAVSERKKMTELGLNWALGIHGYLGGKEWAVGSEKHFRRLMEFYRPIAEAGGWIEVYFDDTRFPMHEDDKKQFGSAREADVYFINKLYKEIKKINPESGIIFCPPFYWGPAHDPSNEFGENREQYLRELGKRLPKDIRIQWTGKSCWSGKIKKEEVEWITERLQRKPSMHQNDTGMPHFGTWHYYTDPVDIWQWHYNGIFNDVQHFSASADSTVYVMTMGDYMWNPEKYDPVKSPLRACAKLVGENNVAKLAALNRLMTQLDPYSFKINFQSVRNADKIAATVTALKKVWQDAVTGENGDMFKNWTTWNHKVNFAETFNTRIQAAVKSGRFTSGNTASFEKAAGKETGYQKKTDILLTAYDFLGGDVPKLYTFRQQDQRICTVVRGSGGSNLNTLSASFKMPTIGGGRKYALLISGQDDDEAGNCEVSISINGNEIFKGPNPLKPFQWGIWSLPIKGMFLKEGENLLEIKAVSKGGAFAGGKFLLVNYAVITTR